MIERLSLILAASLIAITANAAPVELREQVNSRERELVNVMFSSYLADRVGAAVQTAVVDLDSDGVGEIIARFVHTNSCDADMQRCRTTISHFKDGRWNVVFDRYATKIDDIKVGKRQPDNIVVDGMKWQWDLFSKSFEPTKDERWTSIEWQEVPAAQTASYASFFGEGAGKLLATGSGVKIEYSATPISKKKDLVLLRLSGKSVCGTKTGCPVRVVKQTDGKWNAILSSSTMKDASRVITERDGYNDITLETSKGFATYGWNGSVYTVADRIESNRKE
ncbi:hypothetical protein [Mesorhizobium sp. SP-1A]|uniref:hypothetical protein n=1 Tax=Mesorhizobium sp. SP-1A TaxID=3077840 RepID=UPI0028F710A3|nr:hypothetical protein [Mesorhizobium sp. SP-1A]